MKDLYPKKPFKVEDDYFDKLEAKILKQTIDAPKKQNKKFKMLWLYPMAASILILAALAIVPLNSGSNLSEEEIASIENEWIEFYHTEEDTELYEIENYYSEIVEIE